MTGSKDGATMAKVQKTFLIPEELAKIIDKVLSDSGMNFTKFATAALLQLLFDRCASPEETVPFGPDATWINLASRLERGALTVGQIPAELMKNAISMAKHPLEDPEHHRTASENPDWLTLQKRLLRNREQALRDWKESVRENEGEVSAIIKYLDDLYQVGK